MTVDNRYHFTLTDRAGKKIGLVMCDTKGNIAPSFKVVPVNRTALKTTSGGNSYDSLDYPYFPIVQDNWAGGRGNLDFEKDGTKFHDSFRARTSRDNKIYHGPQEQYSKGYRSQNYNVPGNVKFHVLTANMRQVAKRFQSSASYTSGLDWLLVRKAGAPANLTIALYSDSAGQINALLTSISVAHTRLPDILSEWLAEIHSQALVSGIWYWIVITAASTDDETKHWEVAVKNVTGTTYFSEAGGAWGNWTAADFDLYFRITDANSEKKCIYYEYKRQQYKVISPVSGAPKLYMNGERGAADSNSGDLTRLND